MRKANDNIPRAISFFIPLFIIALNVAIFQSIIS